MELTRRNAIVMGAAAILAASLPVRGNAAAGDLIAAFTGGAEVGTGDIRLIAPEIAENGNTVPIEVSSDTAVEIMVLAMGNPTPNVATFKFGKLAASRAASTRIRLAGTQDVVAIAKLEDGSFVQTASTVKVTIGGCGG
ncbi:thiosulfate oxidation carrier protein SoxY [Aestuariivita sp.]|jgi:sulfur-oxidizing protein SoxY|uniref:thiosulfate oxidation carrier protein SoxY n=1 Tax=Aestuariivita sp. TaxID=1872407 RepID=UPI00216DF17E|nr:thiosulfate oxidation carrier protein SoxY [Aestuariivita sp.]MCE8008530.1 thiosulfate oxidation carrier protein SoxY [Aestuariivita sp.]